uniref:Uncharacterized protein n=1 Tax=Panagrolaimus sp. PS1159 TaxID=55785 RepID=A0AC35GX83_9BILA
MCLCTTFVELIPFIGGQTFFIVTGQQLPNFIGPYGFTVSTINVTLSSGIYYTAFKKNIFAPTKIPASAITNSLALTNFR